jgi:hypothetical protein
LSEYEFTEEQAIHEYIAYLVEEGGLILEGITDEGEPIYRHNMEVLKEIAPEYAANHMRELEDALLDLYEKGLVEIEISDEGEVLYKAKPGVLPLD